MTERKKKAPAFSAEERAAMREHAKEVRSRGTKADDEQAVLDKIAELPDADRALAARVHEVVRAAAPDLDPRLWYGMPAYARAGKTVCFFQPAGKFKSRYATLGFNDSAALDDGDMWPVAFALTRLTPQTEARIAELVQRADS